MMTCPNCGSTQVYEFEQGLKQCRICWLKIQHERKPVAKNDLFVMLNHNRFSDVIEDVENSVEILFENRHDHPIWPSHEDRLDAFEEEFHGTIRRSYYRTTILLIQTLRKLKGVSN